MTDDTRILFRRDYLLILAIAFSPMDTLLPGIVGPGEALVALWIVAAVFAQELRFNRHYLFTFWCFLLASFTVGTFAGITRTPNETSPAGLATWIVLGTIAVCAFNVATKRTLYQISTILSRSATLVSLLYFCLFLLWESGVRTLGPVLLDFGRVRFSGGASNPHLLAVVLGFAIFAHICVITRSRKPSVWLLRGTLIAMVVLTATATDSSTFVIASVLTPLTWPLLRIVRMKGSVVERTITILFSLFTLFTVGAIFRNPIARRLDEFVSSDANGYGRIDIWRSFDHILESSPIFGLGPGAHGMYGQSEFHNTFLDIGAIGGLVALLFFTVFVTRVVLSSAAIGNSFLMVLPYIYYGMAGFSARRLSFWLVVPLVLAAIHVYNDEHSSEQAIDHAGVTPTGLAPAGSRIFEPMARTEQRGSSHD